MNVENESVATETGASKRGFSPIAWLKNYLLRHLQTFIYTLGQLSLKPLSTLLTAAVIGIALAMPTGLHLLLTNVTDVLSGWNSATQISLFLDRGISEQRIGHIQQRLTKMSEIGSVEFISKGDALEEFRQHSGFGDALNALEDNPLPDVLLVFPSNTLLGNESALATLREELSGILGVEMALLDMEWIKRLFSLMEVGDRAVWILSLLLAMAVLLIIGNTIRLAIQNRRDEIIITKLIGATDSFIQRPFLYTGIWYGIFGGMIALILVEISVLLLDGPVQQVAQLYHSQFALHGVSMKTFLFVMLSSPLLGFLGSWLAVIRHLRSIEPT